MPINEKNVSTKAFLEVAKQIIEYPKGVVCKHWCVMNLLSKLGENGIDIPKELVVATSESDDVKILEIIDNLLTSNKNLKTKNSKHYSEETPSL